MLDYTAIVEWLKMNSWSNNSRSACVVTLYYGFRESTFPLTREDT